MNKNIKKISIIVAVLAVAGVASVAVNMGQKDKTSIAAENEQVEKSPIEKVESIVDSQQQAEAADSQQQPQAGEAVGKTMTADANAAPEMLTGKISNHLIADAPLPSDFYLGKADAPVVVVEYASLSCPHCAHFSVGVLPELEKNYIDTGKIRYILRHFPHNEPAFAGTKLVECVGKKNKDQYFTFSRVLFDAQSKWAYDGNYEAALKTIAGVGGVSAEDFDACMKNQDIETELLTNKKQAMDELKIDGVPAFYIGGELYTGDRSYEAMSKFIDSKLPK